MPTLAWFRAAPVLASEGLDDTAALIPELRRTYDIDLFDEASAHDFVWRHARRPYDLCVYEMANLPAHAFVWPYLLNFPGVLRLRGAALHECRAFALHLNRRGDDYRAELAFTGWDMLRAAVLASRVVVVSDDQLAARLQRDHPSADIRHVPLGVGRAEAPRPGHQPGALRVGSPAGPGGGTLERAAGRAWAAGARFELVAGNPDDVLRQTDVIVALEWPPTGEPPIPALAGLSLGRAVVVLETEATARWAALDPQTWQPRALVTREMPIVVSIDPRDEEHSLVLTICRLAGDRTLVDRLGAAGFDWWRHHATFAHAAAGWREVLAGAESKAPPPRPEGWPPHLDADGTAHARSILEELGVSVDFLK